MVLNLNLDKKAMLLYAVTDRAWLGNHKLEEQVEETVKAGATFVQLREKELGYEEFVAIAMKIKQVTDRYQVPFVINDNIEVAIAVGADGVHVGQSDMSAENVRALLGNDKILGVSVRTVEQALLAQEQGADYIGVGAAFSTSTKTDVDKISYDMIQAICNAVSIPVVAIGGINETNLMQLKGSGVDGVAVVSAIFAKADITSATKQLLELSQKMVDRK